MVTEIGSLNQSYRRKRSVIYFLYSNFRMSITKLIRTSHKKYEKFDVKVNIFIFSTAILESYTKKHSVILFLPPNLMMPIPNLLWNRH
jgi:hypothetical protein